MELRHLRYFCAVAEQGTFSKASRVLHVSQSAISEQIADLEREMGGTLLNRHPRQNRLTPHGQLFLAEAKRTLLAAERAVDVTRRSLQGQMGTLAIGFSSGVPEISFPGLSGSIANSTPISGFRCMRCIPLSRWRH